MIMLFAAEAFLLGGGDYFTAAHYAGRAIMVEGWDAEYVNLFVQIAHFLEFAIQIIVKIIPLNPNVNMFIIRNHGVKSICHL